MTVRNASTRSVVACKASPKKRSLNVFAGWLVFGYAPSGYLWLGALLILGASLFLMLREAGKETVPA